jgi:hypothetical protein
LEDFGGEIGSSGLKANHALVFIFQSLTLNFTQSIAVFASRGPVKGTYKCDIYVLGFQVYLLVV